NPNTPAGALDDETWNAVLTLARNLLGANVVDGSSGQIVTYRGPRRTTGRMNAEHRLWVYSRGGRACGRRGGRGGRVATDPGWWVDTGGGEAGRRCAARTASRKDGDAARVTYWCPGCQPV